MSRAPAQSVRAAYEAFLRVLVDSPGVDLCVSGGTVTGYLPPSWDELRPEARGALEAMYLAGWNDALGSQCNDLRAEGWAVAVHNDYHQNGELYTFWLFTKGHLAVKGEGRTDTDALNQVRREIVSLMMDKKITEIVIGR
jgi:hypothetical protein